ncbi:MAG: hypothetical protein ABI321_16030 [Polyangia bacterium]
MLRTLLMFIAVVTAGGCASVTTGSNPDMKAAARDLGAAPDLSLSSAPDLLAGEDLSGDLSTHDLAIVDLSPPPDMTVKGSCDSTLCPASCVAACALQNKLGVGSCSGTTCNCVCF